MFEKFSELSKKVISRSEEIAISMGAQVDTHHILMALTTTPGTLAYELLRNYQIDQDQLTLALSLQEAKEIKSLKINKDLKSLLTKSMNIAIKHHHIMVDCEHLLLACLSNKNYSSYLLLLKIGVEPETLKKQTEKLFGELAYLDEVIMDASEEALGVRSDTKEHKIKKPKTPALDYFAHDLVKNAKQNKFDPLIGRETELLNIMQVLLRRNKNNPILVGEPGVGKTALVEGLATLIAKNKAGFDFAKTRIFTLDLALLVAGTTYRGQFEDRVKKIIEELESIPDSIIFIDEIHTLVGAGSAEGSLDMANILKPVLTRKNFRLIGATTQEEFRKYIEKDLALERRFQKISVKEPNRFETKRILETLKNQYEKYHHIKIPSDAIDFVIEATARYLPNRYFPDKAIDVIDQAAASVKIKIPKTKRNPEPDCFAELEKVIEKKKKAIEEEKYKIAENHLEKENQLKEQIKKNSQQKNKELKMLGSITINDCARVISRWSNIPIEHILSLSTKKIVFIEKNLNSKIIGQEDAIKSISQAIWRSRSGVANPNRPIGSFLFLGPTGVGKTELAKNLAYELYGSKDSIIKFDMSEFMERHTVSSLIGAPPGYVGYEDAGRLTETIKNKPYSIVLFDEIEKAHSDIFNILLQIMEDGYLTDSKGKKVNFKNTLIILTSNLGMKELTQEASIGFQNFSSARVFTNQENYKNLQNDIIKKVKEKFAPEFLNRLDQIIIFKPLGKREIEKIVSIAIEELTARLTAQNIQLDISTPVIDFLANEGFNPEMGARPIRRVISQYLETPLAEQLLRKKNKEKKFKIIVKKDKLNIIQ